MTDEVERNALDSPELSSLERRFPNKFWPQCLASVIAASGGLLSGASLGWAGPALMIMSSNNTSVDFHLDNVEQGWVASLVLLGGVFGGPLAGILIDLIGRKATMLVNSTFFAVALLIVEMARDKPTLFVGRLLNGVACGIIAVCAPLYVTEIVTAEYRGLFGSLFQLTITIGLLFINTMGLAEDLRWLTVSAIFLASFWSLALLWIPESPVYYARKGDEDRARESLMYLRGHPYVDRELDEIAASVRQTGGSNTSAKDLVRSHNLKPLLIAILAMFGQQFCGINAIVSYGERIFQSAHAHLDPIVQSSIMDISMVLATAVAALVIDRLGRKVLLNVSAVVMILSLCSLGAFYYLQGHYPDKAHEITWLPLLSLCSFVVAFSLGYGPIPWILMSELFAPEVKGRASSIAAGFNWILGFLVTLFFKQVEDAVGSTATFFGFAVLMTVIATISCAVVPETKGKTLAEIQMIFRGSSGSVVTVSEGDETEEDTSSRTDLIIT